VTSAAIASTDTSPPDVGSVREMSDWNARIIAEFRANEGKVGGQFAGAPMVVLHTTGARTGQERVTPLVYQADGDRVVIFASKAGAPDNPDWYHNLVANPDVTIEVGTETRALRARVAEGDERERLWSRQKQLVPGFADYEANTTRQIPVVVLESTD
jgi:deazaflavin-dependent oxidoreductase (nitroreductase family)